MYQLVQDIDNRRISGKSDKYGHLKIDLKHCCKQWSKQMRNSGKNLQIDKFSKYSNNFPTIFWDYPIVGKCRGGGVTLDGVPDRGGARWDLPDTSKLLGPLWGTAEPVSAPFVGTGGGPPWIWSWCSSLTTFLYCHVAPVYKKPTYLSGMVSAWVPSPPFITVVPLFVESPLNRSHVKHSHVKVKYYKAKLMKIIFQMTISIFSDIDV